MTPEIKKALAHVREYYPDVCMVVFGPDTRWHYMTAEFEAPHFGPEIDVSVLEDAQGSVEEVPCLFYIPDEANAP